MVPATSVCTHHWRIAMPQGEFSDGVCLNCGEARIFRNWEPDLGSMYSKSNGGKNKKVWNNMPLSPVSAEERPLQVYRPQGRTTTGRSRCSEPGCNEVIRGRGLCNKHYKRAMKAATQ